MKCSVWGSDNRNPFLSSRVPTILLVGCVTSNFLMSDRGLYIVLALQKIPWRIPFSYDIQYRNSQILADFNKLVEMSGSTVPNIGWKYVDWNLDRFKRQCILDSGKRGNSLYVCFNSIKNFHEESELALNVFLI